MSFVNTAISLPGSAVSTQPLKACGDCEQDRDPKGGVDLNAKRWICASCWVSRFNPGNHGKHKISRRR